MMNLNEITIKKNYVYNGKIINVRSDDALLPNGKPCKREVVEHPGGVCVAAINEKNQIIFVKQYRYPYGKIILEVPAGKLEKGEDPLECGKRELKEETGAEADYYFSLGELYPTPGYCGETIYMFGAKIKSIDIPSPDEDEFVETIAIDIDKAVEMVKNGEIKDAKTQICVLKMNLFI